MCSDSMSSTAAGRLAYVFYATSDDYARAALVAIHALKKLSVRSGVDIISRNAVGSYTSTRMTSRFVGSTTCSTGLSDP